MLVLCRIDTVADPPLDEVLSVVESRNDVVRSVLEPLEPLTDRDLEQRCGEHTLQQCLWTLFDEEWHHHWYATRDLGCLTDG